MAEAPSSTNPAAGKGKRVAGTFLLMLGAGIVLESSHRWIGGVVLLAGVVAYVRGLLHIRPRTAAAAPQPLGAIDAQPESRA